MAVWERSLDWESESENITLNCEPYDTLNVSKKLSVRIQLVPPTSWKETEHRFAVLTGSFHRTQGGGSFRRPADTTSCVQQYTTLSPEAAISNGYDLPERPAQAHFGARQD